MKENKGKDSAKEDMEKDTGESKERDTARKASKEKDTAEKEMAYTIWTYGEEEDTDKVTKDRARAIGGRSHNGETAA